MVAKYARRRGWGFTDDATISSELELELDITVEAIASSCSVSQASCLGVEVEVADRDVFRACRHSFSWPGLAVSAEVLGLYSPVRCCSSSNWQADDSTVGKFT